MKYKLTDETKTVNGVKLYQIQALKYFGNVKTGDLGGWIEKEKNLSQEGDCWVYGNARVFNNAMVYGDALVYGDAMIFDKAEVFGNAQVYGDALVYGDARVYGNARVFDNAMVYGYARVYYDAIVFGNAQTFGNDKVSAMWCGGNAKVYCNTSISTVKEQTPFNFNTLPEDVEEIVVRGIRYKKEIIWKKIS